MNELGTMLEAIFAVLDDNQELRISVVRSRLPECAVVQVKIVEHDHRGMEAALSRQVLTLPMKGDRFTNSRVMEMNTANLLEHLYDQACILRASVPSFVRNDCDVQPSKEQVIKIKTGS